ncbi:MAG: hypothetical protein KJ677_01455, partial [Gammaproteobacteria bacterium]|nr:hypothetical protein [Gammaproteobacteria bacterium]
MSFTTRCPACGTMFKVVPDQLKISDGWVRCGHCADVFDATLYLQTWEAPEPRPPAPEPAPAEVPPGTTPVHPFDRGPASVPSEAVNEPPIHEPQTTVVGEAIPEASVVWDSSDAVIECANGLSGQTPPAGWPVSPEKEDGDWPLAPPAEEWSPQQEAEDALAWTALQAPVDPLYDSPFAPLEAVRALAEPGPLDFEGRLEQANTPESPAVAGRDDEADFQAELARFAAAAVGASRAVEAEVKAPPPVPLPKPERVPLDDDLQEQEQEQEQEQ